MTTHTRLSTEPLVSVVTPVYNGEPYLRQCIESVLAQTYRNWQYTIFNNQSSDQSLDIAQSYAARDRRIAVRDNSEFLPQTSSLNMAMSLIPQESTYTKMVLPDDWMFPHCLEEMVRVAEQHPSAGIVSSYRLEDRRVSCAGLPPEGTLFSGRDICRATLLTDIFVFGSPSNLLYRSDIVRQRQPFYDEQSLHEDTEACYEILMEHDLGFVHQVLTFTRRQGESLTTARKVYDPNHLLDRLITTLKYGQSYLDPEECAACRRRIESDYHRFLAARFLHGADASFWEYHRVALDPLGYRIRRGALVREVARTVLSGLVDVWPWAAGRTRTGEPGEAVPLRPLAAAAGSPLAPSSLSRGNDDQSPALDDSPSGSLAHDHVA